MFSHKKLPLNFLEGKRILDIGCGRSKLKGSIGLDCNPYDGVDVLANLEEPLPLPDASFDCVYANQVLEHVRELIPLILEIHRILKPGGFLLAHVPYFRSSWAHIDPTHVRSFTLDSLDYFVRDTWYYNLYRFSDISFSSIEKYLDSDYPSTFNRKIFTTLALRNSSKYENSFLSFVAPFEQLTFILKK